MQPSSDTQRASCLKNDVERHQYLARLLINGGTRLLREKFDSIHKPENLQLTLNDPAIKTKLIGIATVHEWHRLYPQDPAKQVSSGDFDLWLILKLFRIICGLSPPVTGWYTMPHGISFEDDLGRIEHYCASVYNEKMPDARFKYLWRAISELILRIARSISTEKKNEWDISIGELLQDPLRYPEVEDYVKNLRIWRARRVSEMLWEIGERIGK